ncbi:MAG: hypothetical protein ACRDIL_06495, partial [Candidatus Limnocylindrales bacterium]
FALDMAAERASDARDERLAVLLAAGLADRPSFIRRGLARTLAALSLGSAAATRRLDSHIADDLGRALAPGK